VPVRDDWNWDAGGPNGRVCFWRPSGRSPGLSLASDPEHRQVSARFAFPNASAADVRRIFLRPRHVARAAAAYQCPVSRTGPLPRDLTATLFPTMTTYSLMRQTSAASRPACDGKDQVTGAPAH
jgi:hypothetical protein